MIKAEVDAANKLIIDSITKYKVIIAGCRDFADYELLKEKCDFYLQNKKMEEEIVVVSGHASGADALVDLKAFVKEAKKLLPYLYIDKSVDEWMKEN